MSTHSQCFFFERWPVPLLPFLCNSIPKVGKYVVLIGQSHLTLSGRYKNAQGKVQICDGEEEMRNGATKKCENVKVQCGQGEGVILILIIHVLLF